MFDILSEDEQFQIALRHHPITFDNAGKQVGVPMLEAQRLKTLRQVVKWLEKWEAQAKYKGGILNMWTMLKDKAQTEGITLGEVERNGNN